MGKRGVADLLRRPSSTRKTKAFRTTFIHFIVRKVRSSKSGTSKDSDSFPLLKRDFGYYLLSATSPVYCLPSQIYQPGINLRFSSSVQENRKLSNLSRHLHEMDMSLWSNSSSSSSESSIDQHQEALTQGFVEALYRTSDIFRKVIQLQRERNRLSQDCQDARAEVNYYEDRVFEQLELARANQQATNQRSPDETAWRSWIHVERDLRRGIDELDIWLARGDPLLEAEVDSDAFDDFLAAGIEDFGVHVLQDDENFRNEVRRCHRAIRTLEGLRGNLRSTEDRMRWFYRRIQAGLYTRDKLPVGSLRVLSLTRKFLIRRVKGAVKAYEKAKIGMASAADVVL
jgi:hypothetical protein